jgi:glycine cleavage system H protein
MVLLLLILMLVVVLGAPALVRILLGKKKPVAELPESVRTPAAIFPKDYLFSPGHLWLDRESNGRTRLGIDELIAGFFHQPDHIHLKKPGEHVTTGETMAILRKGDKEMYLSSPLSGTVVQTHSVLAEAPEMLTVNPYELGWLYVIKPERPNRVVEGLRTGKEARAWMTDELDRLKEFVLGHQPQPVLLNPTLPDGGGLVEGYIDRMDQDAIEMFEREFHSVSW